MKARIAAITSAAAGLFGGRKSDAKKTKRALVHEILSIQVISAALIGVLAIVSLYWGGQWVLRDNYSRWALQWTEQLNELGSPLYLTDNSESRISLDNFVNRYPEIDQVVYFSTDGSVLHSFDHSEDIDDVNALSDSELQEAIDVVGQQKPYLMRGGLIDPKLFEILAPVWVESITDDGLFGFDATSAGDSAETELIGFVKMKLDFMKFHDNLLSNIRSAVLVLIGFLLLFALFGRHALQKALASISDLQKPIQELAKGNLNVSFEQAQHREISDIVEALETTASALSERDAQLRKLANHDSLTGLYNRRRFVEELKAEVMDLTRKDRSSALFFIDLDQFKYINDACGHPAGDRLIRKVADELFRSISKGDVIARFGGDEFAILVRNVDVAGATAAAERILSNMRRMAHVEDDQVFHVHCSIGIAMMSSENLHQDDELINQADIACREAKSAGRNRMRIYTPQDGEGPRHLTDVSWMNCLRDALDNEKFEIVYQPINNIITGETTHHELLIRLKGEDGKHISPEAFLPSAVRFGLMNEIDFWMIRNAAMAYAKYSRPANRLQFAINLSANAFENDDLCEYVRKTFEEFDVNPNDIVFEITESLAIRRPLQVDQQINTLRDLGCRFALDDFGTGYSSFSYLQKLQFDYIKIDGSFVHDLPNNPVDQKMVKLIAEVAREAGMQTIAEYVRDAESLELLAELGVDMAQGYFVGRPIKTPKSKASPISLSMRRQRLSRKNSPSK
jgi:diguanylate cyclase (GGDEF)-like protein